MMHRRESPLVSVIIPCFNQGAFLQESVQSARSSYAGPLEVIVVDDGSTLPATDRYLSEIEKLGDFVRVIRKPNGGLSSARNAGFVASRGSFIQYLDADDLIVAPKIDAQVAHLGIRSDLGVSICDFMLCDEERNKFWTPEDCIGRFALSREDFLYRWERGMSIPIHCGLFRRSVISETSFPEFLHAKEDWVFWTQLSLAGTAMEYLPLRLAIYRQHASSMRRSLLRMAKAWVRATLEIDKVAASTDPTFFETSIEWLNRYYRAQPEYREEIEGRGPIAPPGTMTTEEESRDSVDALLRAAAARTSTAEAGPMISVVVPVYNHYAHLVECLRSVFDQEGTGVELVCVDDCSPDARVGELLDAIARVNPGVKVIHHPENLGISIAQNTGVAAAGGEYVAFLDCDDMLTKGSLAAVRAELARHPEIDYLFTDRWDIDESNEVLRRAEYGGYETIQPSGDIAADLLDGMVASHLKVIRRRSYLEAGGSDQLVAGVQDWDLALKMSQGCRFHYLAQPLYRHRLHAGSVTNSARVSQFRKTNIVRRRHQERLFNRAGIAPLSQAELMRACQTQEQGAVRVFAASDLSGSPAKVTASLKSAWRDGLQCVALIDSEMAHHALNFLREFNSYFDLIVYSSASTCGALVGYMWCGEILRPRWLAGIGTADALVNGSMPQVESTSQG